MHSADKKLHLLFFIYTIKCDNCRGKKIHNPLTLLIKVGVLDFFVGFTYELYLISKRMRTLIRSSDIIKLHRNMSMKDCIIYGFFFFACQTPPFVSVDELP